MVTQVRRPTGPGTDSSAWPSRGRRTTRRPYCTALQVRRSLHCRTHCPTGPAAYGTYFRCVTSRRFGATLRRLARGPVRRVPPARLACSICLPILARPTTWPENTWPLARSCTRRSSITGVCWCRRPTGHSTLREIQPGSTTRGRVGCTDDFSDDISDVRHVYPFKTECV